ncbi:VIT1/CCC1 transporter family protein [Homoserinimonas sp. A447]
MIDTAQHPDELHGRSVGTLLNILRASVLGGQDGIISTAGIVVGVAGASLDNTALLIAGLAGLVSGALSMAGGEYVSVSSQRDTEKALLDKERWELATMPDEELAELAGLYEEKGLSAELARQVAVQLHEKDALAAHAEIELGIDPDQFTNPWHAAVSSAASFAVGAALPLLAITLSPPAVRVYLTFTVVILALVGTGLISAQVGGAPKGRAVLRNVVVGVVTMGVTFGIGSIVGVWI